MTDYKTAAQLTSVPEKLLWKMHREGIIDNPLPDNELRGVAIISYIWRKEWFLRMALADYSHARRLDLIQKPELTRVERYILKCYLNTKEGDRILTCNIIDRVEHYLKAKVTQKQVHRIRSIAYEIRRGRRLDQTED